MPIAFDSLIRVTGQYIDQVIDTETLIRPVDAGEGFASRFGGVPGCGWGEAVVTVAAWLPERLAKIFQQRLAPAAGEIAQSEHRFQLVVGNAFIPLLGIGGMDELTQGDHILQAVTHPCICRLTVTSGPACLLIISLHTLRQIEVSHEAHVGFIYTHAKGDGGDHDQPLFTQEALLMLLPGLSIQSGVIWKCLASVAVEPAGDILDFPA